MSERMYCHMKNTIKDIKTVIDSKEKSVSEKMREINFLISLLKSVECGEKIN